MKYNNEEYYKKRNKRIGFNYAADKDWMQKGRVSTWPVFSSRKVRNKPEYKLTTCVPNFTLLDAWEEVFAYGGRQVSTGLNHYQRDVIICDIDKWIEPNSILKEVEKIGLPHPHAWNVNKNNGHSQIYWFIESVQIKDTYTEGELPGHRKYLDVVKYFNKDLGDPKFTGWQCRNVFTTEIKKYNPDSNKNEVVKEYIYWIDNNIKLYSIEYLYSFINRDTLYKNILSPFIIITNTDVTFPIPEKKQKTIQKIKVTREPQTTLRRKQLAYQETAGDLRNNPALTVSELLKLHLKHYLDICGKSGKPPKQQTIKGFESEMVHLKETFDHSKAKGYTDKQRARSLEVRQENKWITIERIIEMKTEGFKHKYIAEVLHIHVKHISRLLREYKSA
jgi:hypothetical protein